MPTKLSQAASLAALSLQHSDAQGEEFAQKRQAAIDSLAGELGAPLQRAEAAFNAAQARLGCGGGGGRVAAAPPATSDELSRIAERAQSVAGFGGRGEPRSPTRTSTRGANQRSPQRRRPGG